MNARTTNGLVIVSFLGGMGALLWLIGYWIWPHLPAMWLFTKRALSFCAFWLIIALIIRSLWHLGSMFKRKAKP